MKKFNFEEKEKCLIWIIILCVAIFGMSVYRIQELGAPIVLMDEFGYWSTGAFFANLDWSSIAKHNSYYSYGYGLVLSVLIKIFIDTQFLYQSAIVVNGLCVVGAFLVLIKINGKFFRNISEKLNIFICFIVISYPSIYANAHIAWGESFLMFLYVLSVYILIKYLENPRFLTIIMWGVILMFLYVMHQRSLGVLIAGIMVLLFLLILKEVKKSHIICFLGTIFILSIIHVFTKEAIITSVFVGNSNKQITVNDYPSIFAHIKYWFNIEGLVKLISSVLGKIEYLMLASVFLWGIGVVSLIRKLMIMFWGDMKKIKERVDNISIVYLYLLVSFLFVLLIASVFTLDGKRVDTLIYGRYTEWCIAPIVLVGISSMIIHKIDIKIQLLLVVFLLGNTIFLSNIYAKNGEWTDFLAVCALVCFRFYDILKDSSLFLYLIAAISILIWVIYSFCFKNRGEKNNLVILGLVIIAIFNWTFSYITVSRVMDSNYRLELVYEMKEKIKEVDFDSEVLFVFEEGQMIWYVADLQVLRPRKEIKNITKEELFKQSENYFLMIDTYSEMGKYLEQKGKPLVSNWQISLFYIEKCI